MKAWHVVLLALVFYAIGSYFPGPGQAVWSKIQGAV